MKSCTERPAIVSYPASIHILALIMYYRSLKNFKLRYQTKLKYHIINQLNYPNYLSYNFFFRCGGYLFGPVLQWRLPNRNLLLCPSMPNGLPLLCYLKPGKTSYIFHFINFLREQCVLENTFFLIWQRINTVHSFKITFSKMYL